MNPFLKPEAEDVLLPALDGESRLSSLFKQRKLPKVTIFTGDVSGGDWIQRIPLPTPPAHVARYSMRTTARASKPQLFGSLNKTIADLALTESQLSAWLDIAGDCFWEAVPSGLDIRDRLSWVLIRGATPEKLTLVQFKLSWVSCLQASQNRFVPAYHAQGSYDGAREHQIIALRAGVLES